MNRYFKAALSLQWNLSKRENWLLKTAVVAALISFVVTLPIGDSLTDTFDSAKASVLVMASGMLFCRRWSWSRCSG